MSAYYDDWRLCLICFPGLVFDTLQKTYADKGVQTDKVVAAVAVVEEEEDEEEATGKPDKPEEVKAKKKRGLKLPEAQPWPLTNTLRTIQLIYADKVKADAVDDACDNPRQNMEEYVSDWFKNQ